MKANPTKPAPPRSKPPKPPKAAKVESGRYILRLYVAGLMPKSTLAIANMKRICEENLQGQYEMEVIDLYQQPQLAQGDQIVAVPTLIKQLPPPLRRIIGDMSDTERVLVSLDLRGKT